MSECKERCRLELEDLRKHQTERVQSLLREQEEKEQKMKLENQKKEQELKKEIREKEEARKWPTCNSKWQKDKGSTFWCSEAEPRVSVGRVSG